MTYRLLVLDGSYFAHMAYHAEGSMAGPFLWALLDLRDKWQPGAIYVVWDDPEGSGWRRRLSADYKANRPKKPQEYLDQLADLRRVLSWIGVTQFSSRFGEGDDCAATISRRWPGPQLLVTVDKDWLQLVTGKTHVLRLGCGGKGNTLATTEDCQELTGLSPAQWTDYLALAGDTCDGISGVPGIGPTWAKRIVLGVPGFVQRLLAGDRDEEIRELAAAADEAKLGKYVELAISHREAVKLSRELVGLRMVEMEMQAPEPEPELAEVWLLAKELNHVLARI